MKICSKCKKEKNHWEFSINNNRDGLAMTCNECVRIYYLQNRKQYAENKLWRRYGITKIQYKLMLKSQNEVCAICGKMETKKQHGKVQILSVDHDHITGRIRGLLCFDCNTKLGTLENKDWLRKAKRYLEEYS